MTTDWQTIRQRYAEDFGSYPRAQDEAAIIEHFEQTPSVVLHELDRMTAAVKRGEVKHGWSALAARLNTSATPPRNPTVETGNERERRIRNAEQWIHTAGCHYDRWTEIEDDLFGDTGKLRAYADDETLRQQMHDLWLEQRPRGERTEAEAEARAQKWIEDRQRMHDLAAAKKAELDAKQQPAEIEIPF